MVRLYRVLLFDVNQTLLDLSPLRPAFDSLLGSADLMGEWFARLLHGSLVANHLGAYRPFGQIGFEALAAMARARGIEVADSAVREVVEVMLRLPPHPEVADALDRLQGQGYRLAALTNNSSTALHAQIESAGLGAFFDRLISVEEVQRFKPAQEPYRHAVEVMGGNASEYLLVAAHDWDVRGAESAGIAGAFVQRPAVVWSLPGNPPDLVVSDLGELVDALPG